MKIILNAKSLRIRIDNIYYLVVHWSYDLVTFEQVIWTKTFLMRIQNKNFVIYNGVKYKITSYNGSATGLIEINCLKDGQTFSEKVWLRRVWAWMTFVSRRAWEAVRERLRRLWPG